MSTFDGPIYKILPRSDWESAKGSLPWAPIDEQDGFMHLSAPQQVRGTAEKHFSEATNLVLVELDSSAIQGILRWEKSRGGQLFPHAYGPVPLSAAIAVYDLVGETPGDFMFPEDFPDVND